MTNFDFKFTIFLLLFLIKLIFVLRVWGIENHFLFFNYSLSITNHTLK